MNALFQLKQNIAMSIHVHKNLYENVHSRIIHNSANVETASTDMTIDYTYTNCGKSFQRNIIKPWKE